MSHRLGRRVWVVFYAGGHLAWKLAQFDFRPRRPEEIDVGREVGVCHDSEQCPAEGPPEESPPGREMMTGVHAKRNDADEEEKRKTSVEPNVGECQGTHPPVLPLQDEEGSCQQQADGKTRNTSQAKSGNERLGRTGQTEGPDKRVGGSLTVAGRAKNNAKASPATEGGVDLRTVNQTERREGDLDEMEEQVVVYEAIGEDRL